MQPVPTVVSLSRVTERHHRTGQGRGRPRLSSRPGQSGYRERQGPLSTSSRAVCDKDTFIGSVPAGAGACGRAGVADNGSRGDQGGLGPCTPCPSHGGPECSSSNPGSSGQCPRLTEQPLWASWPPGAPSPRNAKEGPQTATWASGCHAFAIPKHMWPRRLGRADGKCLATLCHVGGARVFVTALGLPGALGTRRAAGPHTVPPVLGAAGGATAWKGHAAGLLQKGDLAFILTLAHTSN